MAGRSVPDALRGELLLRKKLCGMSRIASGMPRNSNTDAERGQIQYNRNKGKQIHFHRQSDCGVHCQNANQPKESGLHFARSAASRKISELGVHRFSINGLLAKSDARTRAHSKSPATAGRNTTHKNLRKLATASSSCGELRKLSSIAPSYRSAAASLFRPSSSRTMRLMCL